MGWDGVATVSRPPIEGTLNSDDLAMEVYEGSRSWGCRELRRKNVSHAGGKIRNVTPKRKRGKV